MEAARIIPDLQCSLLCEDVRQEASGNFTLVGVIGFVRVPKLPITALKLCVFNRWTAGVGQFTEHVRLIAADQATVLRESKVKFVLREAASHATNVSVYGQVEFKTPGVYYVEIMVDDVMKLRFPLSVAVVKAKGGAGISPSQPMSPPPGPPPPKGDDEKA